MFSQPSSEVLYLTLFKEFRATLTPVVIEMVQAVQAPCDPENMAAILSKDAGELKMINISKFQPDDYNDNYTDQDVDDDDEFLDDFSI